MLIPFLMVVAQWPNVKYPPDMTWNNGPDSQTPFGKKLRSQRNWLIHETENREDSGYEREIEGSQHYILCELGNGDTLYYLNCVSLSNQPKYRVSITCWKRFGHTPKRVWQVQFKRVAHAGKPKGTLLSMAFHAADSDGACYIPVKRSSQWTRAKQALMSPMYCISYWVSEHAPFWSLRYFVPGPDGQMAVVGQNAHDDPEDVFPVTTDEISWLQRHHKLPKGS